MQIDGGLRSGDDLVGLEGIGRWPTDDPPASRSGQRVLVPCSVRHVGERRSCRDQLTFGIEISPGRFLSGGSVLEHSKADAGRLWPPHGRMASRIGIPPCPCRSDPTLGHPVDGLLVVRTRVDQIERARRLSGGDRWRRTTARARSAPTGWGSFGPKRSFVTPKAIPHRGQSPPGKHRQVGRHAKLQSK